MQRLQPGRGRITRLRGRDFGANAEDIQDPDLPTELTVQIAQEWRDGRADLGCFMVAGTESAPQVRESAVLGDVFQQRLRAAGAVKIGDCPPGRRVPLTSWVLLG